MTAGELSVVGVIPVIQLHPVEGAEQPVSALGSLRFLLAGIHKDLERLKNILLFER